jgi:hypothetical protein
MIEILLKAVNMFSTPPPDEEIIVNLDKFAKGDLVKLRSHYDLWRQRIRTAALSDAILSNGWAFATMSGLAYFEAFVRTDVKVKPIYFDKSGEIERLVDEIPDKLKSQKLTGAMIYGYGNLLRESYFIEQAIRRGILNADRIYLLDCSLFYHIFAQSAMNPLWQIVKKKKVKTELLDYCESDQRSRERLTQIRNELNGIMPALHLFLGNTFCNIDSATISRITDAAVRKGDVLVAEYTNYTDEALRSMEPDYVNTMAIRAAAELFAIPEDTVSADSIPINSSAKAIQIRVPNDGEGNSLSFKSMLRRRYHQSELTNEDFALVSTHNSLAGTLCMDSYRRLQNPSS